MKITVLIPLLLALTLVASPSFAKKNDHDGQLPPGLAKNVKRGKPLPPGWQKKIAPGKILDREVYGHGTIIAPLDPLGIVTIKIDNKVLRVHQKSMEILDILTP